MRLEINYRKICVKTTNTWRLNNTLLNNQEITEEIKEEKDARKNRDMYMCERTTSCTPRTNKPL